MYKIIEKISLLFYKDNNISLVSFIYNSIVDFDYKYINKFYISKNLDLSIFLNFNFNTKYFNRNLCRNILIEETLNLINNLSNY